ncbi:MAG TPA: hypothetical protein VII92_12165 [Anaerolineae bacterium]
MEPLITALTQYQTQQFGTGKVGVNVVQTNRVTAIVSEKAYFRVNAFFTQTIVLDLSHPSEGRIHIVTGGGRPFGLGAAGHMHNRVIEFLQHTCRKNSWALKESKSAA